MANNQLLASDNFSSGSLAAAWAVIPTQVFSQVTGSPFVAETATPGTRSAQMWTGISWPNDQISEMIVANLVSGGTAELWVRVQASSFSGYVVSVSGLTGKATLYRCDSGSFNQLAQSPTLTLQAGDVWSLGIAGDAITVYQNFSQVARYQDATYTSGNPGFSQFATTLPTESKISSWRGYSAVQQDGIWQKQGIVLPALAGDTSGGAGGVAASTILFEGNAQILSGNVYKMWFSAGSPGAENNIFYAESTDGIHWTRRGTTVLANYGSPFLIKNGSTYWMYVQPVGSPGAGDFDAFTSPDGITWTLAGADVFTLGTAGQWDDTIMWYFMPFTIIAGTWYALYSAGHNATTYQLSIGLATSTDGLTWTRHVGNPVLTKANGGSVVNSPAIIKIGSTWYMWIYENQPGRQNGSVPNLDPGEGTRYSTTDFITWTFSAHSVHQSQQYEGVNFNFGQCYPNNIFDVGGKAYMYIQSAVSDNNSPQAYQISLAIAPVPVASVVQFPEDADSQIASDNFSRPNGTLGSNWTTPSSGVDPLQISSNLVEPTTVGGNNNSAVYTGASFSNSQYSEITIAGFLGNSQINFASPTVRASLTANTSYGANIFSPAGTLNGLCAITKTVNGVVTFLSSFFVAITPQIGDVFRVSVVTGSDGFPTISLFQNGFLVQQVQDQSTTPILSGNPGIDTFITSGAVSQVQISKWAGGNANVIPPYTPPLPPPVPATVIGFSPNWYEGQNNAGLSFYVAPGSINGVVYQGSLQTLNIPINPLTGLLNAPVTVYFWLGSNGQIQQASSLPPSGPGLNVYPIAAVMAINVLTGTRPNGFAPQITQAPGIAAVVDLRPITQNNFQF